MKNITLFFIFSVLCALCHTANTAPTFNCGSNWLHIESAVHQLDLPSVPPPSERAPQVGNNFNITIILGAALNDPSNVEFRDSFLLSAQIWETLLSSTVGSIQVTANLANFQNPNILGSTQSDSVDTPHDQFLAAITARTGDMFPTAAQYAANTPFPPSFTYSGMIRSTKAHAKVIGGPAVAATLDSSFGPSDGMITFATGFLDSFDADLSDGLAPGQQNFLTIAIHEFGHLLGFTSAVDIFDSLINGNQSGPFTLPISPIDIYRFQMVPSPDFVNAPRIVDPRTSPHTSYDGQSTLVGGLSRGVTQGDENQASHWLANELSGNLIGMMDPTSGVSELFGISPADDRMFQLMGYQVAGLGANAQLPCPTIFAVFSETHETNRSRIPDLDIFVGETIIVTGYLFRGSNMVCNFNGTIETPATIVGIAESIEIQCQVPEFDGSTVLTVSNDGMIMSNPLQVIINPVICGDGVVNGDEVCDDGNQVSEDGCSADCSVEEEGFDCPPEGGPCEAVENGDSEDDSILGAGFVVDIVVAVAIVLILGLLLLCLCLTCIGVARSE